MVYCEAVFQTCYTFIYIENKLNFQTLNERKSCKIVSLVRLTKNKKLCEFELIYMSHIANRHDILNSGN